MDWVCDDLILTLDIQRDGYILEVGLRYRAQLHDLQVVILPQTALRIFKPWQRNCTQVISKHPK